MYCWRCPNPADWNDVMRGGTIGVPGGTGAGEFAGALMPAAGADVGLEDARQALFSLEAKLEDHVGHGVVVVVDLQLVQNLRVERKPIGPVCRFEQRIDAQDHRDVGSSVGTAVADEGVEIGDVGLVIERGDRGFTMVGGKASLRQEPGDAHRGRQDGERCAHGYLPLNDSE